MLHAARIARGFFDQRVLLRECLYSKERTVRVEPYKASDHVGQGHPIDSMCTGTENHFILFSSNAYLAGRHYPDASFPAGAHIGREKMAVFRLEGAAKKTHGRSSRADWVPVSCGPFLQCPRTHGSPVGHPMTAQDHGQLALRFDIPQRLQRLQTEQRQVEACEV